MRTAIAINQNDAEPNLILINNTFNLCNLSKGMLGNFLVQTIFDEHAKYSNLPLICPVIKGDNYYVHDMPITDKFITDKMRFIVPDLIVKFKLFQTYFIKLRKKGTPIEISNINVVGRFHK